MYIGFNQLIEITLGGGANRTHVDNAFNVIAVCQPSHKLVFVQILGIFTMNKVLPLTFVGYAIHNHQIIAPKSGIEMPSDDRAYHACAASNHYHLLQPKNIVKYQSLKNTCR
jgi:hypothetical protein